MPSDVNLGWVHHEDDTPHLTLDAICNFVLGQVQTVVDGDSSYMARKVAGTGPARDADLACIMCKVLESAGVISSNEIVISKVRMRTYVRGRCAR